MIRILRRKFILTAMLALFILLVLLISCITVLGYLQMERTADSMLKALSNENMDFKPMQKDLRPIFGYQVNPAIPFPAGHFIVYVSAGGVIESVKLMGIKETVEEDATAFAQEVMNSGSTRGKLGSYKYLVTDTEDGGRRIAFLDNTIQITMLKDTFTIACFVGAACMVMMFIILLPISMRAIHPIAVNMEKQKQFVTNAGHEIKTPLAIIMSNVDAMELHQGESRWSRNIRSQSERMSGLMQQMLLLARADEGASGFPFEEINLSILANNITASFFEPAKQRHLKLNVRIEEKIILNGNRDALEMLFHILLDNALKYTSDNGSITVCLITESRKCRLYVRNSIACLPSVVPAALFDRFYRADSARTQKNGGYGIGLSVAQAIVGLHHGRIEAVYEDKHTICFNMEFPQAVVQNYDSTDKKATL